MCQAHGVGILVWSPLAMGILAGRYLDWDGQVEHYPANSRAALDVQGRAGGGIYSERVTPEAVAVGNQFVQLAKEYGISPAQLALLWAKDQEGITAPLAGARTMEQLEGILPVLGMELDDSVRAACDELVPPGTNVANFRNTALWGKQRTEVPWGDGSPRV
jgi:aryl-alcohol dehydrogenase-like predicted oxidoreductase